MFTTVYAHFLAAANPSGMAGTCHLPIDQLPLAPSCYKRESWYLLRYPVLPKQTMAETKTQQLHVIAITFPSSSHPAQILNVTRRLASAAPGVAFSFLNTAESNASLFGASNASAGFDNIKVYDIDNGIPENYVFSGRPFEKNELFLRAAHDNLKKGIEKAVSDLEREVSCVVSDAFVWMSGDIAEELQVPWIPVWAPGASSLSSHFYTDRIRKKLEGKNKDDLLTFIPGLSSARFCDLPREIFIKDSYLGCLLHKAGLTMPQATAVVVNTFEELEPTVIKDFKSKFRNCLSIGPFTMSSPSDSEDAYGCVSWLDNQEPASVAYVSFGTAATPPPKELVALAEALEASGIPFLWSIKDRMKVHLPDGFLDRAGDKCKVVPWSPQTKVLQHSSVGVFVTHCGWNSVLESIMCGVPMIYRPFFGDHMLIGRFVSSTWEIGVGAGDGVFTKDETIKCLDLILHSEQGKKMKENAEVLKEKALQAVGSGGSSNKNFNTLLEIVITGQ